MAVRGVRTEVAHAGLVAPSRGATVPATVGASASTARSAVRRTWWQRLVPICQALGVVAAVVALIKLARPLGALLRSAHLDMQWGTLAVASITWMVSYAQLAQLWGMSLAWWEPSSDEGRHDLKWQPAMRAFFVANLARYVPGTVWQFASLGAMSAEGGASPLTASIAAVMLQVVLLITNVVLVLASAPPLLGAWSRGLSLPAQLILATLLLVGLVAASPRLLPLVSRSVGRLTRRPVPLPQPPRGPFAAYVVRTVLAWIGYAVAFWLFGRALFAAAAPSFALAGTVYLASYLLVMLAIWAPGGIVVREAALVAQLAGPLGMPHALVLAGVSRVWLVALEIVSACAIVVIGRTSRLVLSWRSATLRLQRHQQPLGATATPETGPRS